MLANVKARSSTGTLMHPAPIGAMRAAVVVAVSQSATGRSGSALLTRAALIGLTAWMLLGVLDIAGALGGLAGGLAGFPGSFVTIWCSMRGWDKLRQRATYQPYILVMQIVTIACLWWQAPARASVAQDFAFVPFALLGAIGGLAVFQRLTNRQFHGAVSILLVVSGVGLLARGL